jgi:hypothetical protein
VRAGIEVDIVDCMDSVDTVDKSTLSMQSTMSIPSIHLARGAWPFALPPVQIRVIKLTIRAIVRHYLEHVIL